MNLILFLILAILVLSGAHYLVYWSAARFFGLNISAKKILAATLGFLMVSFVLSSLAAHYWQDNAGARAFYTLSSFWLGWLINLTLVCVAAWLAILFLRFCGMSANKAAVGAIFFGLSLVVALGGAWNAFHPAVKNITVKIRDLPAGWQGEKIVMISDAHLGYIYRADFMTEMAEKINAQRPAIILIAGDLFDGFDGGLMDGVVAALNKLAAPRGVYFVTGNHETYLGLEKTKAILAQTKIRILNDEIKIIDGLQLIGVSYPAGSAFNRDVAAAVKAAGYSADLPSILMYHQPTNIADVKNLGVDLQLAGHTHAGQIWPVNYFVKLVFNGYEYGLKKDGDYIEYTSSGLGTWGPPVRTGSRPEIVVIELL